MRNREGHPLVRAVVPAISLFESVEGNDHDMPGRSRALLTMRLGPHYQPRAIPGQRRDRLGDVTLEPGGIGNFDLGDHVSGTLLRHDVPPQYDFGRPSTRSAMCDRIS